MPPSTPHKITQMLHQTNPQLNLYNSTTFNHLAIPVTTEFIVNELLPAYLEKSSQLVEKMTQRAISSGTRYAALENRTEPTTTDYIAALLSDKKVRKGSPVTTTENGTVSWRSWQFIKSLIGNTIEQGRTLELALPAFPRKIFSPVKVRGLHGDLGDGFTLLFFAEIIQAINNLYNLYPSESTKKSRLLIFADGTWNQRSSGASIEEIRTFQQDIQDWIELLGLEEQITLLDYKQYVEKLSNDLGETVKQTIGSKFRNLQEAIEFKLNEAETVWELILSEFLMPREMENTFTAIKAKTESEEFAPWLKSHLAGTSFEETDYLHSMKRLLQDVPLLFESRLYSIDQLHLRSYYQEQQPPQFRDYGQFYLEQMRNVYQPQQQEELEKLRLKTIIRTWRSTRVYLAQMQVNRLYDLLRLGYEHRLRCTVHPKVGQLGLHTGEQRNPTDISWHGVLHFEETSKGGIRGDLGATLPVEGQGMIPLVITPSYYWSENITEAELITTEDKPLLRHRGILASPLTCPRDPQLKVIRQFAAEKPQPLAYLGKSSSGELLTLNNLLEKPHRGR